MADDTQAAPPVTLDSVRQKYPQYKDVDDDTLARGLHQKFYSQMPFNDFAAKVGYKPAVVGAADTPPPAQEEPGIGRQVLDVGKDLAGTVARGAGTLVGVGKNAMNIPAGGPYENPSERGAAWAKPFEHPGDTEPTIHKIGSYIPVVQAATAAGDVAHRAAQIPAVKSAIESPAGQFVGDVVKPASEIASAAGTVYGASSALKAGAGALDVGINAINPNNAAQAARVGANSDIVKARANGWKLTADDVRGRTNPVDPNKPNADLPGPNETTPDIQDKINVHNQAKATHEMAADVKLPNTRNINPDEVSERMAQEGKTYGRVGDAIGNSRPASTVLDHDVSMAAARDADPAIQAKVDKDVSFYRDELKGNFDGPKAVQTVRTLRNSAQELNSSKVPGDQARGKTYQNIANAIEDEMMRQLPAGAQDLHTAFPAARQQLAKLYELNAVSEGGQVNAAKVAALDEGQLTGAAQSVAHAAKTAPQSMQAPRGAPSAITTAPTPGRGFWIDTWNVAKAAAHKIPGMNPASDAYQASHYGKAGGLNATPPASAAPSVSEIRKPVDLKPPPGNAGNGKQGEMPLPPGPAAPPAFELAPPEGTAHEPAQRPLIRNGQPGKVMDPAEWDRQALARVREMSPAERAKAEGPAVPHDKLDTTVKSRRGRPLGQAFNRERE